MDGANNILQMAVPPANKLKKLSGTDHWSVRVNDQWRIVFLWDGKDASEVALVDYH